MGFWGSACEVGGVRVHTVSSVDSDDSIHATTTMLYCGVSGRGWAIHADKPQQASVDGLLCATDCLSCRDMLVGWVSPLHLGFAGCMSTGAQCVLCCSVFSELCCVSKQQHHSCLQSEEPEESVPSITCIQTAWSWHKTYYAGAGCMDRHGMHGDTVC